MPCLDSLDLDEQAPNMRLKLAGAHTREELRCLAREPFFCASTSLRLRVLRPQLKRDPLGARQTSAGHT